MDEIVSIGGDPREAGLHRMIDRVDPVVEEDRDRLRETAEDHLEAAVEGSGHYSFFSTLFYIKNEPRKDATEIVVLLLAIVILVRAIATETLEIVENPAKGAYPKKKSRSPLPQIQKTSTCVP